MFSLNIHFSRPYITERLLMGRKESNQTNKYSFEKFECSTMHIQAKHTSTERRYGGQPPRLAKEENPLVYSMGSYEREQAQKIRDERHKDLAKFYEEQVYDIIYNVVIYIAVDFIKLLLY